MSEKIRSEIICVTPEMAKKFLSFNEQNRRIRPGWVNYLAYSIKMGEWQSTHQGIAFSESGMLLDGQHRLMAIVKAGIPVNLMVTYGMTDSVFSAIDNGMKRTDEDLTKLSIRTTEISKFFITVTAFEGIESPKEKNRVTQKSPRRKFIYTQMC